MRPATHPLQILLVCLGNICRSPLAEGLLRHHLQQQDLYHLVRLNSAATHAYMLGNAPAEGSIREASLRGVDIGQHRARLISPDDIALADMILVMDEQNLQHVRGLLPEGWSGSLQLITDYDNTGMLSNIPDPYGQEQAMFERMARLLERCFPELVREIRRNLEEMPEGDEV